MFQSYMCIIYYKKVKDYLNIKMEYTLMFVISLFMIPAVIGLTLTIIE